MSRELDVEGWILVAVALVGGIRAGWLIVFHGWNENVTRAAAYTVAIFVLLVMALRPAWHRLRLWVDLGISLVLHSIVVLSLLKFASWRITPLPQPSNYFAYNFIKIHRTLRTSPAMAAGVTDRLWSVEDLVVLWKAYEQRRAERAA